MNRHIITLILIAGGLLAVFVVLESGQYLDFDSLKAHQSELNAYRSAYPFRTAALFFLIFVIVTGTSLPGAGIMSLAGGAIFGLWWGSLIVSFASAIGATIAFLATRYLFRDMVQRHFPDRLAVINRGVQEDGPYYLFILRLMPVFPFFIINILTALTSLSPGWFYLITQLGMLPSTLVLVNAGQQIALINAPADILSPRLLVAFALLGIVPLLTKKLALYLRASRHISEQALKPPDNQH